MTTLRQFVKVFGTVANRAPTKLNWPDAERRIGLRLPADYKVFTEAYGSCSVGGFLNVLNPFSPNPHLNLLRQLDIRLDALRLLMSESEQVPFAPEAVVGGLVPWGVTDNGDVAYWRIRATAPESWTVVINEGRGERWVEFVEPFAAFIIGFSNENRFVPFFPPDLAVSKTLTPLD